MTDTTPAFQPVAVCVYSFANGSFFTDRYDDSLPALYRAGSEGAANGGNTAAVLLPAAEYDRLRTLAALPASGLPNEAQYTREAALMTIEELRNAYVAARLLLDVKAWRVLGKSAVVEMEAGA